VAGYLGSLICLVHAVNSSLIMSLRFRYLANSHPAAAQLYVVPLWNISGDSRVLSNIIITAIATSLSEFNCFCIGSYFWTASGIFGFCSVFSAVAMSSSGISTIAHARSDCEARIYKYFKYCQAAFGAAGMKISFPIGTDPKKTYKWRYLEHFVKKIDEWGVSDIAVKSIIFSIVKYCKDNRILYSKGMAILSMDNILDIGYRDMQMNHEIFRQACAVLKMNQRFVNEHGGIDNINIIKWYQSGGVSKLYIIFSKRCLKALRGVSEAHRLMVPSYDELWRIRQKYVMIKEIREAAKRYLGDDCNVS